MKKSTLNPVQRETVDIIQSLGFGSIEHLCICSGLPCYQPEPRVIQSIKLDGETERQIDRNCVDLDLKKEFEGLFDQLNQLGDCLVDIEVRHGLPVRLVVERRVEALL